MAADFSITGEVKLNSDPAEKATSKWTVAAGQLIADFAKKAASSLKSVVKSGLDYNAQMESYLTNFKVMLGDEQLAAEKLEEIRRMAASTPFSLSDLTEGTQTLLQFGVAADDTTGVLKRLGDISLGNADKLQTLVRAYGKMSSAQKVTLENVNMMIDAGFNPLNQICDATGESMSALYKRISDGKVSFNELEAAVAAATSEGGQFYNGMLEASQTFNGRLSTLKDNVAALAALAAGLVTAYHTSETFRNIVNGAFQAVASIAQSTIGAAIGWLDKLSYRLNSFLGKDGYTGFDSYDDYKASKTPAKFNTTTDADRQRRQQLHESRVQRSQASTGTADAAASATAAAAAATSAAKSTKQATADIIKSISDTTTAVKDGVTTTTETVTETLSNGTTQQKQTMAVSSRVAASGTAQVAAAARSYREGDTNITQNIYSKAHTAADLQREARWEADRAKAQNR